MSELPKGWVVSKIDLLCSKPEQLKPEASRKFNYIDISSVNRETKTICEPSEIFGKDAPSRARKIVNTGDVLVSMTRPNLNAVAKVPDKYNGQIASTGFDVLKPILIEPNWLFSVVKSKSFIDSISGTTIGALYPACKASDIRGYEMPVPPLNEQKRIVEKLDEVLAQVDTIKARLDSIPAILKRFRQSVLAAAVSGKLTEEWRESNQHPEWILKKLKDITFSISDGDHQAPPRADSGIPFLVISNVSSGCIDFEGVTRWVPQEYFDGLKDVRIPKHGDLLYTVTGSFGIPVKVNTEDKFCFQRHIAILKSDSSIVDRDYLFYWLSSPIAMNQAQETATAQKTVSLTSLRNFQCSLPFIDEQKEIVRLVEQYFAFADTIEAQVKKAQTRVDNLTQSILAKAFRGELVDQDPNDEPADKLLERIAAARKEAEALAKAAKKAQSTKSVAKKKTAKSA
ncbi:restriction endonuclease subunit S [Photobacterium piscicola]|uniref:restriction endonuclease subunit S n=1 Tax=Photobacterium piscicola TaxID=1378299 RepID=UPI002E1815F5|nr:restriction endonuclease subunit S [Photobacterium piscicola]